MQPIRELSSAVGLCAGRGCALIRQLANRYDYNSEKILEQTHRLKQNITVNN